MKKILFIIHSLSSGGAEKVLIDILDEFDYSRYDVTLLLIKREGRYIERVNSNVKLLFLHSQTVVCRIFNRILSEFKLYESFTNYKIIKTVTQNFDTIVSFSHGDSLKYHSKILKKGRNNVTWIHCDMWNRGLYQKINIRREEFFYDSMDKIIFVSNDAQNQFNRLYGNKIKTKQEVIYNLIHVEKIKKLADAEIITRESKFTICTVGRFYEEKAYDRLIRVSAMLKEKGYDFQLWIVAEGILFKELQELAIRLNVADRVVFWGFKSNPYPYIKNADIFISTSRTEAMPLVICEALCLGKPIISTKTTGPIELLSGNFGILTEHDDISIYNAIINLIVNRELLEYYSVKAIERAKIFNISNTFELIYKTI